MLIPLEFKISELNHFSLFKTFVLFILFFLKTFKNLHNILQEYFDIFQQNSTPLSLIIKTYFFKVLLFKLRETKENW